MNGSRLFPRSIAIFAISTFPIVSLAVVCPAQEQGHQKPTPLVGMISLIVKDPVQNELGIDKASQEYAEIRDLLKSLSAVIQNRLNHPTEEDRADQLGPQELYAKVEAEFVSELKQRLSPDQYRRLQQIHWQQWGIRSIEDPDVVQMLGLTDEQVNRVLTAKKEFGDQKKELEQQRQELRQQGANLDEIKQKFRDLAGRREKAYTEILTAGQREQFTELKGKPFDLSEPATQSASFAGLPARSRSGGLISLAILEPVLEELRINAASDVATALRKLSRSYLQELRQQQKQRETRSRESETALQAKYDDEVQRLLTDEQFVRLRQIHWQRLGTEAFGEADVIQTLKISKKQLGQFTALNLELMDITRGLLSASGKEAQNGNGLNEAVRTKLQEAVTEKDRKVLELLSPAQQQRWAEMTGEPFDVNLIRRSVTGP